MEVSCCGSGGGGGGRFHFLRFSGSGTRTKNHCFSIKARSSSSDLCPFGIASGISSHACLVGYHVLLPARPLLSTKIQCVVHEVEEILLSQDEHIPIHEEVAKVSTKLCLKHERLIAQLNRQLSEGVLPPYFLYLMDLGLKLEQIKQMTTKYPILATWSVEQRYKPFVEFLLELGVRRSDVPRIIHRCPRLCGFSIQGVLKPRLVYLESLGFDKSNLVSILCLQPGLLTRSRRKFKAFISYFLQVGFPYESILKLLITAPILGCLSIENKIAPAMASLESLGVDKSRMAKVICRCPQLLWSSEKRTMGIIDHFSQLGLPDESIGKLLMKTPKLFSLSVDKNIKPTTGFLLSQGFTNEDIIKMVTNLGVIYYCNLEKTLMPKWEFFLQMGYPKSALVKFPQYFGYSLEDRIKPRYNLVKKHGVSFTLNFMLSPAEEDFQGILRRKLEEKNILSAALWSDNIRIA